MSSLIRGTHSLFEGSKWIWTSQKPCAVYPAPTKVSAWLATACYPLQPERKRNEHAGAGYKELARFPPIPAAIGL